MASVASRVRAMDVYARLMLVVSVIAALAHLGFIFLFQAVGASQLAVLNFASVLTHLLAAGLILRERTPAAAFLIATEVLVHGTVATMWIGWAAGFHHYIVLILPVVVVSGYFPAWVKASLALLAGLFYIGLDALFRHAQPPLVVPDAVLDALHYLNLAAMLAILAVLASVYFRLVSRAEWRLRELACTDPLTQLRNRRFAMDVAQHEAAVFERGGRPLAILLGDIDHFKRINDAHGHAAGDTVLRAVARVLRDGVREVDHVARWGGEEFLVLLPATDVQEAMRVADRLRGAVEALPELGELREFAGLAGLGLTLTLGVASLRPGETVEQALVRADRALYDGKQAGRNRVLLAAQD
ncbi:MAG: GGDEF domain-containing protein [Burkholderiales bacterium]|nr:GGDEF domain-containing protein [Burkholderiales bacterium]MBH2016133.1 GGDEF domain-containing protein [Burkholderiales bacterium]